MGYAAPRRSPVTFGAVTLAHAALLSLLLIPTVPSILREGANGPGRAGGEFRSEVALIEMEPDAPRLTAPPVITVPTRVAVMDVAMPALELGDLEPTAEEKLRGLYLGQVRARIERAWEAAANRSSARDAAGCDVRVTQDTRGGVLEVAFGECRVESAERDALVRIIRGAAPLPAPPSDLPFTGQVALSLRLAQ
jgi:hypothetical protein